MQCYVAERNRNAVNRTQQVFKKFLGAITTIYEFDVSIEQTAREFANCELILHPILLFLALSNRTNGSIIYQWVKMFKKFF